MTKFVGERRGNKMKERNGCQFGDHSRKDKGKARKSKAVTKLFASSNWPKVMISRDDRVCERTEVFTEITPSLSRQEANGEEEVDEAGDCDVEHLCCDEKEEQGICLITSSSEIQENLGTKDSADAKENGLEDIDELLKEKDNDGLMAGNVIIKSAIEEKPIFVDLTTDEKSIWKHTILKRSCDVMPPVVVSEEERETKYHTAEIMIEPQIMIADSSNKMHNAGSLATALRDRGAYLIPVQPNRSLPIRPAPLPTRSIRKNGTSLLALSKPANQDVVEVVSAKSISVTSDESIWKHNDPSSETPETLLRGSSAPKCVVPQISNVSSFDGTEKRSNDDREQEKDCAKENKRKKKSHEADSSQGSEDGSKSSIKEFLRNFCGSTDNSGTRNRCTDKCTSVVSTTDCKKKGCAKLVVPPLRLKKVVRTETERCDDSLVVAGINNESNYKIVKDKTSRLQSSSNSTTWTNLLHEKGTNSEPLNSNNCKVKYRRNRLKQKLRELRTKASDLAKLIADDSSSQQDTRLRQVMNRYEKQIENLSKLHNKLSAAFPSSEKDDDLESPSKVEYLFLGSNEKEHESMEKKPSISTSPEPPKLSPRSDTSYENIPPEDIRNSPPILPRVCLIISPSQGEDRQISENKIQPVNEELMDQTVSADSVGDSSVKKISNDLGECKRPKEKNLNIEANDFHVDQKYFNHSDNIVQVFDDSHSKKQKDEEKREMEEEELSPGRLVIHEEEKINSIGFPDCGPVISSVISGPEVAATVSADHTFESTSDKPILQTDSFESSQKEARVDVGKLKQTVQQVTSSSKQSIQIEFVEAPSKQETITLKQNCKREKPSIDGAQENTSNYTITEQFPTLGNWVARMSKNVGTLPLKGPIGNPREPISKMQKTAPPNVSNGIMNAPLQYGTEGWEYYHQQQQRQQQLLQHVASVTLAQPVPMVPPYRPAIYPPISVNQYYPNNYTTDPYNNAALNYHPAICPYSPHPYNSRLHPPSLSGYHYPLQEGLRPLQYPDKRYPPLQEPIMKYSSPITNHLQQSSTLPSDRLRGNINGNNGGLPSLPSLFLPPTSLPSSQQALSGPTLPGYPTTNQLSRKRIIPDVVAAAAAAAVVAAASLDKQRDLACNVRKTELANATMTNIADSNTPFAGNCNKTEILHMNNQSHDSGFSEDVHQNSTKYQRMQNYLFDRLNLVSRANEFMQPSSTSDNRLQMAAVDSSTLQRILSPQMTKTIPEHEIRNCETPHLGKINRSPNSLYNLICSNCGAIGPKFKCLGCEMVFYCDGRCQQKHWSLHGRRCPKKMPKLKKVS